jgi:hypothetical protein
VEWLTVTLAIYRRAARRAGELALRNWPVLGTVFAYEAIWILSMLIAVPFGIVGGLFLGLVYAACVSSFLAMVEAMVRTSKVTWGDFQSSFGAYLWDVMGVYFVLWIFSIVQPMILAAPQGTLIIFFIWILAFVFFNAVPELIYVGHHSAFELFAESYRFISDNWIEWFPPNGFLFFAAVGLFGLPVGNTALLVAKSAAIALFIYFAMVMRGLLFLELYRSSRRARAFRYRAGG